MAQSPAQRRAAQRRLAKEIKTGSYKPTNASKQARQAAQRLRENRDPGFRGPPVFIDDGPPVRDGIKVRIKRKKRQLWQDALGFTPTRSDRNVDESDDTTEMAAVEGQGENRWNYLASQASYAQMAFEKTGDAGELVIYLPYTFLFYH